MVERGEKWQHRLYSRQSTHASSLEGGRGLGVSAGSRDCGVHTWELQLGPEAGSDLGGPVDRICVNVCEYVCNPVSQSNIHAPHTANRIMYLDDLAGLYIHVSPITLPASLRPPNNSSRPSPT